MLISEIIQAREPISETQLGVGELGKRDNWELFKQRVVNKVPFIYNVADKPQSEILLSPEPELLAALGGRSFEGTPYKKGASILLPVTGGGTVNIKALLKDKEFATTGGKGYNTGDVAEAVLGAAVAMNIVKHGDKITADDIIDLLRRASKTAKLGGNSNSILTTELSLSVNQKSHTDDLIFRVGLNNKSYSALLEYAEKGRFPDDIQGTINSSIGFVNNSGHKGLAKLNDEIQNNKEVDHVVISSEGTKDQKGTKADLFMTVNDERIGMLSLKAGNVKAFGQGQGSSGSKLNEFVVNTFGIEMQDSDIEKLDASQGNDESAVNNRIEIIEKSVFPYIFKRMKRQLSGDEGEVSFINNIYNGILHHATLSDTAVEMVIVGDKPKSDEYHLLQFGPELREAMEHIDLDIYQAPQNKNKTTSKLIVAAKQESDEMKSIAGNATLCSIRCQFLPSAKRILMIVEMGGLLKKLAKVGQE